MPRFTWNWAGVVGTGQSLSVGEQGSILTATVQPHQNLKLSLGGLVVPPFDSENAALSLVPLVELIRPRASTYPSAYPQNIYGETPHTAMASQISALVQQVSGQDYVTVHSVVGENGQGMPLLSKGATEVVETTTSKGRAFAATLFEARAIQRLATAANKTYGVGAIVITHGESDSGNTNYEADLIRLWTDYNQDIVAITGQVDPIPMFVSQQHSVPFTARMTSGASASTLAQWRVGLSRPGEIVCSGPKYQYPYAADGVHLVTLGYDLLGEKYGQVYYERVVLGRDWQPLQPLTLRRDGPQAVSVDFHVPVPPLVWDEVIPLPHQTALTEWAAGRGFEVRSGSNPIPIESVAIEGETVRITCATEIPPGAVVGYAVTSDGTQMPGGTTRWGQLRDSDAVVGATTGTAQPNYAVAFELSVP
jgi:hypothetical protein